MLDPDVKIHRYIVELFAIARNCLIWLLISVLNRIYWISVAVIQAIKARALTNLRMLSTKRSMSILIVSYIILLGPLGVGDLELYTWNSSLLHVSIKFSLADAVHVIAEPGRFYVASAFTLATSIHSKRSVRGDENSSTSNTVTHNMYYINDGVYGSFNCLLYDHRHVTPLPLKVGCFTLRQITKHFFLFINWCLYFVLLAWLWKVDTIEHLGPDVRRIGQSCRRRHVAWHGNWRLGPFRKYGCVYVARRLAVQWIPSAQGAYCRWWKYLVRKKFIRYFCFFFFSIKNIDFTSIFFQIGFYWKMLCLWPKIILLLAIQWLTCDLVWIWKRIISIYGWTPIQQWTWHRRKY